MKYLFITLFLLLTLSSFSQERPNNKEHYFGTYLASGKEFGIHYYSSKRKWFRFKNQIGFKQYEKLDDWLYQSGLNNYYTEEIIKGSGYSWWDILFGNSNYEPIRQLVTGKKLDLQTGFYPQYGIPISNMVHLNRDHRRISLILGTGLQTSIVKGREVLLHNSLMKKFTDSQSYYEKKNEYYHIINKTRLLTSLILELGITFQTKSKYRIGSSAVGHVLTKSKGINLKDYAEIKFTLSKKNK